MARPVVYQPDTVYVYPDTEEHVGYESGPGVQQNFRLVVDLVLNDQGEQAAQVRDPDVTAALRTHYTAYADRVRLHNGDGVNDHLRIAGIDWQALTGLEYRGVRLRLAGYKLWP